MNQKDVWNVLADSWANLRTKPYPEVIEFAKSEIKEPVLDIGCGNGRNLIPFLRKKKMCIGLDFSEKMVELAKGFLKKQGYKAELKVSDMVDMPLENEEVGTIICNSALHSLDSRKNRLKALFEMKRVLRKDSKMLISVWNRCQRKFFWKIFLSFFKKNRFDVWMDWDYHGKKYKRFYHLYSKKEIRKDFDFVGLGIEKIWVSKGNIWVLVRK